MCRSVVVWSFAMLVVADRASDASPPDVDLRQCVDIRDKHVPPDEYGIAAAVRDALARPPANPRVVCIPAGVYDVRSTVDLGDPFGTGVPATDLTIVGDGPASILKMRAGPPGWSLSASTTALRASAFAT